MSTRITATTGADSATAAICARGLRKSFGEKTVLDGIDLTVQQGSILALLGRPVPGIPRSLTRQPRSP
jgi:ABC-2 type transport system ATP-binding protein